MEGVSDCQRAAGGRVLLPRMRSAWVRLTMAPSARASAHSASSYAGRTWTERGRSIGDASVREARLHRCTDPATARLGFWRDWGSRRPRRVGLRSSWNAPSGGRSKLG